jgi:mono/diheme cytochrome c family protein
MAVARSRLLRRRQADPSADVSPRRRAVLPLSMMAALCIIGLAACATEDDRIVSVEPSLDSFGREYPEDFVMAGRKIALEQCASCHAVDRHNVSPNRAAPPLNALFSRYDPDRLADDLIAGTWVGHEEMPRFDFNVIAADSLIAYLETIDKDRGER